MANGKKQESLISSMSANAWFFLFLTSTMQIRCREHVLHRGEHQEESHESQSTHHTPSVQQEEEAVK